MTIDLTARAVSLELHAYGMTTHLQRQHGAAFLMMLFSRANVHTAARKDQPQT